MEESSMEEYYAKLFAKKDRIISLQKKMLNTLFIILIILILGLYPLTLLKH